MPTAFSSPKQAAGFALLLLVILLLPILAGKTFLPSREQAYSSLPWDIINYPYIHQQIFEEKGDIDIAFLGASRMGCSIDSPYVQDRLSEKLGRPAVVRSLSWTWNGYDALFFIGRDLMEHRHVRMLVFDDLSADPGRGDTAHRQTSSWFRYGDNAADISGLPLRAQATFYASAILGMPRNLVGLLRSNLGVTDQAGFDHYHVPFDYTPAVTVDSSAVCIYPETGREKFQFSHDSIPATQLAFIQKITALAREHGTQLVFLHEPRQMEHSATRIMESNFWPDVFGVPLPLVSIPPADLFAGLTDDDVNKLYFNPEHFNQNGKRLFTKVITPALVHLYEDQIKP